MQWLWKERNSFLPLALSQMLLLWFIQYKTFMIKIHKEYEQLIQCSHNVDNTVAHECLECMKHFCLSFHQLMSAAHSRILIRCKVLNSEDDGPNFWYVTILTKLAEINNKRDIFISCSFFQNIFLTRFVIYFSIFWWIYGSLEFQAEQFVYIIQNGSCFRGTKRMKT